MRKREFSSGIFQIKDKTSFIMYSEGMFGIYLFVCLFVCSFVCSFDRLVSSGIPKACLAFIYVFICLFIRSFVRSIDR